MKGDKSCPFCKVLAFPFERKSELFVILFMLTTFAFFYQAGRSELHPVPLVTIGGGIALIWITLGNAWVRKGKKK